MGHLRNITALALLLAWEGCKGSDDRSPFDAASQGASSEGTASEGTAGTAGAGSSAGSGTGGAEGSGGTAGAGDTGGTGGTGGGATTGGGSGGSTGGGGPLCGNGQIDPGEECDTVELGGKTCQDLGFPGGALTCNPDCTYHTESCDLACAAAGDFCKNDGDCCEGFTCDTFFEECQGA